MMDPVSQMLAIARALHQAGAISDEDLASCEEKAKAQVEVARLMDKMLPDDVS